MSNTTTNVSNDPKKNSKQHVHFHTYTPRSHEELLKKFSQSTAKSEHAEDLKRENIYLKRELSSSKKQLKRLQRRMSLENNNKKKDVKDASPFLQSVPESRNVIQSEVSLENDDEFVQSWEVLGHHFSEVIRRHHEVLAEKDRQIRELQEKQYNRDISKRLLSSSVDDMALQSSENPISGMIEDTKRHDGFRVQRNSNLERDKTGLQSSESRNYQCADRCDCTELDHHREDHSVCSGESISEHFSEVIRRHKQQLVEKDHQIQELKQALEMCVGRNPHSRRVDDSEVQMWYHDYHDLSRDSVGKHHPSPRPAATNSSRPSHRTHSDDWASSPTSSDEEDDSLVGSTDTFVAIEKCQRLESISNLERLRQNLLDRLELEEKLDRLYWQAEMNRYRALKEEAGDNFDPNGPFNKDFEMLETTRLELLRALKDLAAREPEIYVQPHVPLQEVDRIVDSQVEVQFPNVESQRRVSFQEKITITTVQTRYDPGSNDI